MKKLLIIPFLFITFSVFAQNSAAHRLFDKYEDQEGFTSVLISDYAFQLLADVAEGSEEDFEQAAKMITGLRILTTENKQKAPQFLKELRSTFDLKSSFYKPLMTVKSDGEEVLFYLKEQNKKISEFILLVQSPESPVMILIEGNDIDLNKLKDLAGNTEIDALDQLKNIEN